MWRSARVLRERGPVAPVEIAQLRDAAATDAGSQTLRPVLGVAMESASLKGLDSLLSTAQMPGGIPVGTLAIGKPRATNAALLAIAILAIGRPGLRDKLKQFRAEQAQKTLQEKLDG